MRATIPYPPQRPTSRDDLPAAGPASLPTLWLRLGARLFDQLVLGIPLVAISLPYLDPTPTDGKLFDLPHWASITSLVVPIVYEIVFLVIAGATPGKMLCGIAVRRYVDGGQVSLHQAGLRVLVPALGSILALVVSTGWADVLSVLEPLMYATAAFDSLLRGIHDHAAGTIVVRTR